MNRLYVFYNIEASAEGKPFSMCDKCKKSYRSPENCIMREIAKNANDSCNVCGKS